MIKIEYSIVSIGTEKAGSRGYMSVSECDANGYKYLCALPHFSYEADRSDINSGLRFSGYLSIEAIAIIRFQLISFLALRNIDLSILDNICIIGGGAIGIATYFELQRLGIEKVAIKTRRKNYENILQTHKFNICNSSIDKYSCIIDSTGNENILRWIINNVHECTTIILLGTPRNGSMVDMLTVHRKNLRILGGHELNGIKPSDRQDAIDAISNWYLSNKNIKIYDFVRIHRADEYELEQILNHKFLEPFNIISYIN